MVSVISLTYYYPTEHYVKFCSVLIEFLLLICNCVRVSMHCTPYIICKNILSIVFYKTTYLSLNMVYLKLDQDQVVITFFCIIHLTSYHIINIEFMFTRIFQLGSR